MSGTNSITRVLVAFFAIGCHAQVNLQVGNQDISSPSNSSLTGPVSFHAPLHCGGDSSLIVPQAFYVRLRPSHSLQNHSSAIGQEIYPFIDWMPGWPGYRKSYFAQSVDDQLLEAILSDPMVEVVECESLLPEQELAINHED